MISAQNAVLRELVIEFAVEINVLSLLMTWKNWTISFQDLWIKAMELVMSCKDKRVIGTAILDEISFGYMSSATCRKK